MVGSIVDFVLSPRHVKLWAQAYVIFDLGCLWLGLLAAFAFGKSQKPTKGLGCHSKPQTKAAFA
jgi:hypothetical protein